MSDDEQVVPSAVPPFSRRHAVASLACSLAWYGVLMAHPLTRILMWDRTLELPLSWIPRTINFAAVMLTGLGTAWCLRRQLRMDGLIMACINGLRLFVLGSVSCVLVINMSMLVIQPDKMSWGEVAEALIPTLLTPVLLLHISWWYMLPLAVLTAWVLHAASESGRVLSGGEGGGVRAA